MSETPIPVSEYLKSLAKVKDINYLWGGKRPAEGLDCSGTVTWALMDAGGPDRRFGTSAAGLYDLTHPADDGTRQAGMLAFYGHPGQVTHVMTVWSCHNVSGEWTVYGGCGGNHYTTTAAMAKKQGAKVQERPSIAYRPDLLMVGRLKFLDYTK